MARRWNIAAELDRVNGDNINATAIPVDNKAYVFILSNYFNF